MLKNFSIPQDTSEDELFRLIQEGDQDAFTIVYQKYHKMLYALAFRYLKNIEKAEDVVQNAFIKLWEFHAELSISVSLKNYLYTMTKNFILNQIRNENNAMIHNYKLIQSNDDYEDNLLENIEKKELLSIFNNALDCLPDQKRTVCKHKMEDKLSNQEIADKMDISINTVKTHYAQSLKILRTYMEKMLIFLMFFILL